MQIAGEVDYIYITSCDCDYLAYPGLDNIVYNPGVIPSRKNGPPSIVGRLVHRAELMVARNVRIRPRAEPRFAHVNFGCWEPLRLLLLACLIGADYGGAKGVGLGLSLQDGGLAREPTQPSLKTFADLAHAFATKSWYTDVMLALCGFVLAPVIAATGAIVLAMHVEESKEVSRRRG
jgi:hypothetical protein